MRLRRIRTPLGVDKATSVLFADGDAERLDAMLEVGEDARLLTYGARSASVAITIIERHEVDAVVVAADFEPRRVDEVLRAARGRRCITVAVEPDPSEGERRLRHQAALAWPFTPEMIRAVLGR